MTTKIGYARVSSTSQSFDVQVEQLNNAGCTIIRSEKQSGKSSNLDNRTELATCIEFLRPGDSLVVTKPDRLARSTRDLLNIEAQIAAKGASLVVLSLGLDTATPQGKLMLTMLAGIAEFELALIKERQADGIAAAKEKGVYKGRKATSEEKAAQVVELCNQGVTKDEIAERLDMARTTVFKILKEHKEKANDKAEPSTKAKAPTRRTTAKQ